MVIDIEANAFLYHMVRNIAGVLLAIGAGIKPVSWAEQVLLAKDRTVAGNRAALWFVPGRVTIPSLFNCHHPTPDLSF